MSFSYKTPQPALLQQVGMVHQVDHGKPGFNKSSWIRTVIWSQAYDRSTCRSLRLLDNSRIRQLADCQLADRTTRGLDKSQTGQLADATGDFACLVFVLLAPSASPRVVQSATCPVRELAIRELAYPRVVQLPSLRPSMVRRSSD